jgi:hypothetical protein
MTCAQPRKKNFRAEKESKKILAKHLPPLKLALNQNEPKNRIGGDALWPLRRNLLLKNPLLKNPRRKRNNFSTMPVNPGLKVLDLVPGLSSRVHFCLLSQRVCAFDSPHGKTCL